MAAGSPDQQRGARASPPPEPTDQSWVDGDHLTGEWGGARSALARSRRHDRRGLRERRLHRARRDRGARPRRCGAHARQPQARPVGRRHALRAGAEQPRQRDQRPRRLGVSRSPTSRPRRTPSSPSCSSSRRCSTTGCGSGSASRTPTATSARRGSAATSSTTTSACSRTRRCRRIRRTGLGAIVDRRSRSRGWSARPRSTRAARRSAASASPRRFATAAATRWRRASR